MRSAVSQSSALQCCCGFPGCGKCADWAQQLKPLKKQKKPDISSLGASKFYRGLLILALTGLSLISLSCITYYIDPQSLAIKIVLTMSDGSFIFKLWQKPPVPVYLKVYIFNVTNPAEFLAGNEKLRLQEVGPYIYREYLEHENVRFNDNGTITFTPRRYAEPSAALLADTAAGRGLEDRLVVPNIPLLGIASKLADYSMLHQMAFSTLVNTVNSQPFDKVNVRDYLWGYDDPIVKIANTMFSDWVTFKRLGLLDRMFDIGRDVITMDTSTFNIDRYNGATLLHEGEDEDTWTERDLTPKACRESFEGVSEGVLFTRNMPRTNVSVYRKAFCRTLAIQFDREEPAENVNGVPGGLRFHIPGRVFNASQTPAHKCHCGRQSPRSECTLMDGLSDITNCYYGIPAAASFPHFYNGDPRLREKIDGLHPNAHEHEPYIVIQEKIGIPIAGHMRMQTNLILRKSKHIRRIARFGDMALPIVWTDLTIGDLPSHLQWMLDACLKIVPPVQYGLIYVSASLGFSLLLAAMFGYLCYSSSDPMMAHDQAPLTSRHYHVIMAQDLLVPKDYSIAV